MAESCGIRTGTLGRECTKWRRVSVGLTAPIEALECLRETAKYELMTKCRPQAGLLDQVAEQQNAALKAEIEELTAEAEALEGEIRELQGANSGI